MYAQAKQRCVGVLCEGDSKLFERRYRNVSGTYRKSNEAMPMHMRQCNNKMQV